MHLEVIHVTLEQNFGDAHRHLGRGSNFSLCFGHGFVMSEMAVTQAAHKDTFIKFHASGLCLPSTASTNKQYYTQDQFIEYLLYIHIALQ